MVVQRRRMAPASTFRNQAMKPPPSLSPPSFSSLMEAIFSLVAVTALLMRLKRTFFSPGFLGLMNCTQMSGFTVMARNQLSSSEIMITWNSVRVYSPVASGDIPTAAKAKIATTVAPKSGHMVWSTTAFAASFLSSPFCIRTRMPSVMTMELSTSIPIAMMSAPREMRWSVMSITYMKRSVPEMISTSIKPMITPLWTPMKITRRPTTIATD